MNRLDELLSQMSLKEKIGQVTQIYYVSENHEETMELIRDIQPGSIILCDSAFAGNEQQESVQVDGVNQLQRVAVEETSKGIPILFGRDVIHGHKVVFPIPLTMCATFDYDLVEEAYHAIREEAICDGIKWTFAPMLDVSRDPRWGRIIESPGEDPYLGACMAKAVVRGFQTDDLSREDAMAACAKHFVGYGASEGGRDYSHTEIGEYLLQNIYLPAFRSAIEAGVATVMSSFNDVNSIPVSANRHLLTEVLRGQMGFEGFVVSDWDAIRQMMAYSGFAADKKHAAELAIHAGIDMDMADNCYLEHMEELILEGTVSEEELDEAVKRILKVKLEMGLFEHPYVKSASYDENKHCHLAQRVAEESMVLLKNNHGILPLSKSAKIGVGGPYLHNTTDLVGSWALDTDYRLVISPMEALQACAPDAEFVDGSECMSDVVSLWNECDCIVLFLGESRKVTGEAHSVASIEITDNQKAIIQNARKCGKPVVGVLCFGRPIALGETEPLFDAIIYAGHGGTCAAQAIASGLFGDAEPGGRLPFTLPYATGQIPLYYNVQPGARQINGYYRDENPYHRNYMDCSGAPVYPFGYGMSYTKFTFSGYTCDSDSVSLGELQQGKRIHIYFDITNTGDRKGNTVVQLYVQDVLASRMRPLRALRDFKKITLLPGETKAVSLSVGYEDLGFYLEDGEFILETGEFVLYVGESCLAEQSFRIMVTKASGGRL